MTGEWLPEERLRTVEGGLFRLMTVVPGMECPPDPVKELWCGHAASSGMMFLREVLMMGECTAKSREGQCHALTHSKSKRNRGIASWENRNENHGNIHTFLPSDRHTI